MRKLLAAIICLILATLIVSGSSFMDARRDAARQTESAAARVLESYNIASFKLIKLKSVRIECREFESLDNAHKLSLLKELNAALGREAELYTEAESCYYLVTREKIRSGGIYSRPGLYFRCDSAIWFIY